MAINRRWRPWLAVGAIVATGTIGIAFFAETANLGGDALNGHITDGHYFVGSHGGYTEVTADQWTLSRNLGVAMMASVPIGMVAMAFLLFRYVFPFVMTGQAAAPASARVAAIRATGWPVWSGSPGGVVGGVNFTMAMLDVGVYPGGIVLKPRFMTPIAIEAAEIRSVRFGRRLVSSTIEIDHTSKEAASPVLIYGGQDSGQAQAIQALAGGRLTGVVASAAAPGWPPPPVAIAPSVEAPRPTPPAPMRVLGILGLVVAVLMVVAGLLYVIPTFGPFGVIWTAVALFILISNGRRFLRKGW